jgi:membrane-bound PQQ-dependent dehydrogenase (glucose/quinate/shikimate family)
MLVLRITAVVFLLIGVFLAAGGAWLAVLGGSPYYVVAGVLITASAVLLWMRNAWGATVFELTATATLVWALWEAGMDGWALAPRVVLPFLLTAWLFTPWVRRALHKDSDEDEDHGRSAKSAAAGIAIAFLAGAVGLGVSQLRAGEDAGADDGPVNGDWIYAGGDAGGSHYSQLTQINENNVEQLERAWQFRTGVSAAASAGQTVSFDATPIEIDDTLYLCTPNNVVIALNAENGAERWRFDPRTRTEGAKTIACRGVAYYAREGADGACSKRIVAATVDARLFAVDAGTGQPCADFGGRGVVSLLEGVGEVLPGSFAMTAPPLVVGERVMVGGWVKFRNAPNETFGYVRAFDVRSGRRLWTWDMGRTEQGARRIPQTPDPWSGLVADEELNQLYVATENDIPDFAAGRRTSYGSSVVALDLASGQPKWSFQAVHGDRWNSDLAAPVLVDLQTITGRTPALVQATGQGQIFVLDRRSGKAMVDVTEQPAPRGAAGDTVAGTQPISELSLLPPPLREVDMWGLTPLDQLVCRIRFKAARYEGPFTPPGGGASIAYPGHQGLIGSGGVAVDQINKLVVAPVSAIASYVSADGTARPFMGPLSLPCNEPPWGLMHLVDLKTDRHAWGLPVGSFSMLPLTVGAPNLGGPLVTRGVLIFHSGTADNTLRAYNLFTGEELWSAGLPAGGQAAPMTYTTRSGKQFVVVVAGGSSALGTSQGDYVVAYALP